MWQEPIDRNVWRLLTEFGDAQIAGMIAPRTLVIEACAVPETEGPLPVKSGRRGGAAPGQIKTAELSAVKAEFQIAKGIYEKLNQVSRIQLISSGEDGRGPCFCEASVTAFLAGLGRQTPSTKFKHPPVRLKEPFDHSAIQQRQVTEAVAFTQNLLRSSHKTRENLFSQADRSSVDQWMVSAEKLREHVYRELIGQLPEPTMPLNPRTRKVLEESEYVGYEVVLDTYPDVIAAGILLLPKGIKPDEKRPVVVCQHGLEGVPMDTISGPGSRRLQILQGICRRTGQTRIHHVRTTESVSWSGSISHFAAEIEPVGSIAVQLYHSTASGDVEVACITSPSRSESPRILWTFLWWQNGCPCPTAASPRAGQPGYCLSICSADFSEWVSKNASVDAPFSYVFTPEYEIFEWNMGHVANYAELSYLMTPRPFMVERGHDDGVSIDEWVAWEYAKVRRHYNKLGLGEKTEIEFFNGPHTINGQATYDFLHRHLNWPKLKS